MTPTYSNLPVPEYPHYYVLDVADIVEELLHSWQAVIADVVQKQPPGEITYPQVYRIDLGNGEPVIEAYFGQHQFSLNGGWRPDVSFIIHHAIDAVKQNAPTAGDDVEMALQLLEFDIATMAHHQLLPNVPMNVMHVAYAEGRMKLAKLAAVFGKQLFQRFAQLGLYKNGYFPYHFAGWQDTCVLVEVDDTHR